MRIVRLLLTTVTTERLQTRLQAGPGNRWRVPSVVTVSRIGSHDA